MMPAQAILSNTALPTLAPLACLRVQAGEQRPARPRIPLLALVATGHLLVALLLMSQPGRQMISESTAVFVTLLQEAPATASRAAPSLRDAPAMPQLHQPAPLQLSLPPVLIASAIPPESSTVGGIDAAPSNAPSRASATMAATRNTPPTDPRFDADYLNNPAPVYPALSRRMGEAGRVLLRVQVDAGGSAVALEVRTSSGSPRLDTAALDAVRRWKFVPARQGDDNVSAWVLVPINFSLRNTA